LGKPRFWAFQVERESTDDSKNAITPFFTIQIKKKWNQEKAHYPLNLICCGQQNKTNQTNSL
jgi:hypothetical protein